MTHRQKWVVLNAVGYGVGSKSWSHKFTRWRFTDWNFCNLYWSHLIDLSSWSQGLCYAFKSSNFSFQTPCLAEPCKNGGMCKPNYGDGNYECQCLIGSKGKNCHEGNIKYKMHSPVFTLFLQFFPTLLLLFLLFLFLPSKTLTSRWERIKSDLVRLKFGKSHL